MIIDGEEYIRTREAHDIGLTAGQLEYMKERGLIKFKKVKNSVYLRRSDVIKMKADRDTGGRLLPKAAISSVSNYAKKPVVAFQKKEPERPTFLNKDGMHKLIKVLDYVSKTMMEESEIGRKMFNDLQPIISTDLIVIKDFMRQVLSRTEAKK